MNPIYLTYARHTGQFPYNLLDLKNAGCEGIRIINKNLAVGELTARLQELKSNMSSSGASMPIMVDLPGTQPHIGPTAMPVAVQGGMQFALVFEGGNASNVAGMPLVPVVNVPSGFVQAAAQNVGAGACAAVCATVTEIHLSDLVVVLTATTDIELTEGQAISHLAGAFVYGALSAADQQAIIELNGNPNYDHVVMSFPGTGADITGLRNQLGGSASVWAKVWKKLETSQLNALIAASNGVIFDRFAYHEQGDLTDIAAYQADVVAKAQQLGKPILISGGILDSLATSPWPTISETMDASAIDALSAGVLLVGNVAKSNPIPAVSYLDAV